MITLTPTELQSVINAALFEIARHPESYKNANKKASEIYRWLIKTNWDNPNEVCIMIDEMPF